MSTATEPKGVPYNFAACEVLEAHTWITVGRRRKPIERWFVHSKSEPGTWYLIEYRQRFLCCSCKFGQIVFSAWVEVNDESRDLTLERQLQLTKRLGEKCAHMRARDAYVAAVDEANRVPRPEAAANIGAFFD